MQLFTHPELYYPYLAPISPPVAEALLTPFYVEGKAVGTVWIVAHDEARKFDAEDLRLIESLSRFAAAAYPLWIALDRRFRKSSGHKILPLLLSSLLCRHGVPARAVFALETGMPAHGGDLCKWQTRR